MEKISVIVPIYKVEKYLNNCIESLVNQEYKNIEIILVDDGSPDNCPRICDDWEKKDKRIIVIHKKNGGLSDARNCGIENAKGAYICFVDSDDYVEKRYLSELLKANKDNNTKISQCGIKYIDENNNYLKKKGYEKDIVLSGKEMVKQQFGIHDIENTVAWNRLYDISLFKDLRFPKGKLHEDEYTTYKLLYPQSNISIVSSNLYCYRQTTNSIMRSAFNMKRLDVLDGLKEKIYFFKNKNEVDLYYLSVSKYLSSIRFLYSNIKRSYPNENEKLSHLKSEYRNYYNISKSYRKYKISTKIKNKLFNIFPEFYANLKNV